MREEAGVASTLPRFQKVFRLKKTPHHPRHPKKHPPRTAMNFEDQQLDYLRKIKNYLLVIMILFILPLIFAIVFGVLGVVAGAAAGKSLGQK